MPPKHSPKKTSIPKSSAPKSSAPRSSAKDKPSSKPKRAARPVEDPTTDESLLALDPSYAVAPDMPVVIALREIASLSRLARTEQARLAKIGITAAKLDHLAAFGQRLTTLEKAWQKARAAVNLTEAQRKLRKEAEALDAELVAGGRWACRDDAAAQKELSRIAEGSGLADTVQDLRDLIDFWAEHESELGATDITKKHLERAAELADALEEAAANEESDIGAATTQDLRNRCFWAADALAKEVREGGRYAFRDKPKIAAKFVSRHRTSLNRRSREKANTKPQPGPSKDTDA